jgi:hypothetical protein
MQTYDGLLHSVCQEVRAGYFNTCFCLTSCSTVYVSGVAINHTILRSARSVGVDARIHEQFCVRPAVRMYAFRNWLTRRIGCFVRFQRRLQQQVLCSEKSCFLFHLGSCALEWKYAWIIVLMLPAWRLMYECNALVASCPYQCAAPFRHSSS